MSHPFLADRLANARIAELHADAERSRLIRRLGGVRRRGRAHDTPAAVLDLDARRAVTPVADAGDSRVA